MDDFLMLLVDDWLMNLSDFFFVDDRLMGLMNNWLMVLMNNVLMMFMNYLLVVLVDHVLVVLFYNWLINVSLNCGSFDMFLNQGFPGMSFDSRFLLVSNDCCTFMALLDDWLVNGLDLGSLAEKHGLVSAAKLASRAFIAGLDIRGTVETNMSIA